MASQGPGRKRTPNRNGVTPEEDALNVIAREAEARLTAKRAARAEAREIRMKELERQQKEIYQVQKEDSEQYTHHSQRRASLSEYSSLLGSSSRTSSRASSRCTSPVENTNSSVASFLQKAASSSGVRDLYHVTIPELPDLDDGLERDFFNKGSSRVSTISTSTLTSLGGASSSKESGDSSVTADTETSLQDIKEIHELKDQIHDVETKYTQNLKEIKDSLSEMEIKYRNTMVSNAQLDNEKSNLVYEVDTLKDSLMELEEVLSETRRECEEKSKDLEREKHAHSILQFQFSEQKETLKQSEGLLTEIRQLHVKKDEFIREISDLQETVKWKDKKIKALEKQKEFSDAIRNERDELRDEVVQLKDILKKHGIALGSDLCTNGEVGVNVSGGAACTELERGSSVLGTQKLQLFRDENVGGSRRGQLQHPQEFGHGIEENHLPSSGPGSSFKSHMRAQYEGVGLGIYLTNAIEKIQNNVEKTQAVSEANAEKKVVLENVKEPTEPNANIIEGIRTDQQESPLYVKRSETIKERSHDFANKLTCEMKKDIDQNLDETVVGDSQMVTDNSPLAKIDTVNSQCASISVKKKKKKKKQKQKHNCDEKDVRLKIGENKNQRGSVQTVVSECKSVHLEEATVNEKVTDNVNMNKTVDRADIAIGNPPHDHLLKSITGDLTASLLTNSKDARLKDIVAFCAEISTGTQLGDTVDTAEVFQEKQETFTDTKLGDSVDTAEFCEEKKETFTDIQLGDTVDTAKVLEEKQKTFTDAHLGDTLDTVELHQEKQETFTGTLPGDNVDTAEVFQEKQETSTGMPLGSTVDTAEVYQKKQKTFTGTQLYDTVDTAEVLEETQKTFTDTYLGDTVDRVEVYQKKQETFTGMQPDDTVDTAEVLEEKQEIFTDMHLSDTVDTAEVYQEKQETFTGMQLDDTVATAKFLEEKKESQQPLHIDQKFNLERDECEMEIEESFDFNMKVIKLEEHLLGDNDCQKEHIIPWCEKQTCTTSERPELADTKNEDQKLQIDEQNFLMEKDKGASVAQIPTPGGNCETYGQEFLPGYEEQGSKTHKEMIHFEHNGKQGTSPAKDVKVLDALLP